MGRPKTNDFWEEWVRKYTENEPRLGPLSIHKEFEAVVEKSGRNDLPPIPSERTIGRIQQRYRALPPKDRWRYREFRWPEDMENGLLPWEASAAALELVRLYEVVGWGRPPIGVVRWFSRVTAIAPDAPFSERSQAALHLDVNPMFTIPTRQDAINRGAERWLAFKPWRSDYDAARYEVALKGAESFPHGTSFGALARFVEYIQEKNREKSSLPDTGESITNEEVPQCEDTSADGGQNGQPSSASGTTKTAGESSSGSAASRPRKQRRKS